MAYMGKYVILGQIPITVLQALPIDYGEPPSAGSQPCATCQLLHP
jgi:hypothetical protein